MSEGQDLMGMDWDEPQSIPNMETVAREWHRRLIQGNVWRDASGAFLDIEEMDPGHRGNVIRWLRERAGNVRQLFDIGSMLAGEGPGDMEILDPAEWLYTTPLYQALVAAQIDT